jgi:DNA-directed RNA polymerase subunit K/omega
MKFYDLDDLSKKTGVKNKYLLTTMLSSWARKISEEKGRLLEEGGEKYISMALEDIEKASLAETGKSMILIKRSEAEVEKDGENSLEE